MRSGRWRVLGVSMAVGAAYDAAFAIAILAFLEPAADLLGLAVPTDPLYVRLNGVFLMMLAAVYTAAAVDPVRYRAVVWTAIFGRSGGAVYLGHAWSGGGAPVLLALALGDLVFALVHAVLLACAMRAARPGDR